MIGIEAVRVARGKALMFGFLLAAFMAAMLLAAKPAHAAPFEVNSAGDAGDTTPDGVCDSNPAVQIVTCTLREAIQEANATPGADNINFNISGTGPHTISPASELPAISDTVTIDGYTQPGATLNTQAQGTNANLLIELDGTNAGVDAEGLNIVGSASNTVIRGLVINRFDSHGISSNSTGIKVEGNFIGTDATGTATDVGNQGTGITPLGGGSHTIGGPNLADRNLISGNGFQGVFFSSGNKVEGNLIGTQKDGASPLGNALNGVATSGSNNTIGSDSAPNTIAFNGQDGIFIGGGTGNRIVRNSIFSNGGLGIDLAGGTEDANGVTKNDKKDADTGANNLQNYPVLKPAKKTPGAIQVTLSSTPNTTFTVRFFSSPTADPSGFGEGKTFRTQAIFVTTNKKGKASFTFPVATTPGEPFVSATATNDATGDTSEFSNAVPVN